MEEVKITVWQAVKFGFGFGLGMFLWCGLAAIIGFVFLTQTTFSIR